MSQSSDRATRRDLRRAMGQSAVDRLVLLERAISQHGELLHHLRKDHDRLKARTDDASGLIEGQRRALIEQGDNIVRMFYGRTFWQRLRWLVTGR